MTEYTKSNQDARSWERYGHVCLEKRVQVLDDQDLYSSFIPVI